MAAYHAVAQIESDGRVEIDRVGTMPTLPHLTYRTVRPISETIEVVVWWPERVDPEQEAALVDAFVQTFKDQFQPD